MQLAKKVPNDIEVIFKPLAKDELKEEESRFIQDWIPQFNKKENPRHEIRPIQTVIVRIVNETNREWTFSDIKDDLLIKWRGEVSLERKPWKIGVETFQDIVEQYLQKEY